MTGALSPLPAAFIIGSSQSDALLLGLALGSHPELAMLPAAYFIPGIARACQRASRPAERFVEHVTRHAHWPDFQIDQETLRAAVLSLEPFTVGGGLRAFYRAYAARLGKPRYGDTTMDYCQYAEQIQALLPEARFIHLIGDAHGAALAPRTADEIARHWAANLRAARSQSHELRHYLEVYYESLVREPETTLRQICAFLDLSWDPAMLAHYQLSTAAAAPQPGAERRDRHPLAETPAQSQQITAGRAAEPGEQAPVETEAGDRTAPAPASVAVCITGMHRSGTSLVAQILHHCGPYLGPYRLLAVPLADNLDGYWEHPAFRELNDDILAHFGGGWDAAPALPDGWEELPEIEPLRQRARTLIDQFDGQPCWGWKDPRTALTMPFWRQLLPGLKVVICVRNPLEVARSLSQRGMSSLAFGLRLWHTYYERLLAAVDPADRIVTHYDAYFADAAVEASRMLAWLGIPTSSEIVRRVCEGAVDQLRHQRATMTELLACGAPAAVLRLYAQLCDEVGAPGGIALASIAPKIAAADDSTPARPDEAFTAALALLHVQASERAAALAKSQTDMLQLVLQAREAEVAFLSPALAARETELAAAHALVRARETELAGYVGELGSVRDLLAAHEAELEATHALVRAREAELAGYARELKAMHDRLVTREAELEATHALVRAREAELAGYARELKAMHDRLVTREAELEAAHALVRAREAELAGYARELKAMHDRLVTREAELEAAHALVRAREAELAGHVGELGSMRELLAARETELAGHVGELGSMRELLAARETELEATRALVRAREAELAGYTDKSH